MNHVPCDRVLCEVPDQSIAYTEVPDGYEGPCQLTIPNQSPKAIVFPSVRQACRAAKFAIGEIGGYVLAVVSPAEDKKVTHETWESWAFD
jgi:hypothetical protein